MVYVRNHVTLDFNHFCQRVYQSGWTKEDEPTPNSFKQLLKDKISNTNMDMVKNDVRPFIKNPSEMDIWTKDYFMQLADMMRFG